MYGSSLGLPKNGPRNGSRYFPGNDPGTVDKWLGIRIGE